MANVATTRTAVPVKYSSNIGGYTKITPVICTFDTLASDLTIYTPAATNYCGIVGLVYEVAAAHSVTFTSGSTALVTLVRTTNESASMPVGTCGFMLVSGLGEALKIQCTVAVIPTMLVYVAEFSAINLLGL